MTISKTKKLPKEIVMHDVTINYGTDSPDNAAIICKGCYTSNCLDYGSGYHDLPEAINDYGVYLNDPQDFDHDTNCPVAKLGDKLPKMDDDGESFFTIDYEISRMYQDDVKDSIIYTVKQFVEEVLHNPPFIATIGSNMGWRNLSGYKLASLEEFLENPLGAMGLERDYDHSIKLEIQDDELGFAVYSHDAPMGESYRILGLNVQPRCVGEGASSDAVMYDDDGYTYTSDDGLLSYAYDDVMFELARAAGYNMSDSTEIMEPKTLDISGETDVPMQFESYWREFEKRFVQRKNSNKHDLISIISMSTPTLGESDNTGFENVYGAINMTNTARYSSLMDNPIGPVFDTVFAKLYTRVDSNFDVNDMLNIEYSDELFQPNSPLLTQINMSDKGDYLRIDLPHLGGNGMTVFMIPHTLHIANEAKEKIANDIYCLIAKGFLPQYHNYETSNFGTYHTESELTNWHDDTESRRIVNEFDHSIVNAQRYAMSFIVDKINKTAKDRENAKYVKRVKL